jgi:uncharacterized phage protein (TIGR01671 family)
MREIKFRGYDGMDWIYSSIIQYEKEAGIWRMIEDEAPDDDWVMVCKVGQYTGLKDINGNEIYEGDILGYGYVVTYVDGSDNANLGMDVGFYEQRDNFESWSLLEVGAEYEIIGNIHDNPELIKNEVTK